MTSPLTVPCCRSCGYLAYPARIICPRCGAADWAPALADVGVVEQVTIRRPVLQRRQLPWGNWLDQSETRLASVRTDAGPRVICRIAAGVGPGERVTLTADGSTAIAVPGHVVDADPAG
jgi:uncharacterized OB-fold protein